MLSYHREAGCVSFGHTGRLELGDNILLTLYVYCDIIGLQSYQIWWKVQNKSCYAVQGHYLIVININWHPILYCFGVSTAYCSNFGHCVLSPQKGLGTTYDVHLGLIGKGVVNFLLVLIELFSLAVTAEALQMKVDWKSAIFFAPMLSVWPKILGRRGHPTNHFCTDS